MSDIYAIVDLEGYAVEMRKAAAESLADNYNENLDEFITINQMINIIDEECVGYDETNRPLLDEDSNGNIFDSVVTWIYNVGLAKLAAKGLVECAWDNQTNEMIFWTPSGNLTPKEEETKDESKPKNKRKNRKSKG